jgi:16S rRNA (guanine966-N2)-methyltransferase
MSRDQGQQQMSRRKGRQRDRSVRGAAPGRVRIIAGDWRGRQLPVHDRDGLRPTGDRLRETLFNWLAPFVHGARCLDLFAGSGALGFEALSRGAARCDLVDSDAAIVRSLRGHLQDFGAQDRGVAHFADALAFLDAGEGSDGARTWDIVFVDPPFAADLATPALASLVRGGHLADGALIYLENARYAGPAIPGELSIVKDSGSGAVEGRLLEFVGTNTGRSV